jgi:hypothetical protein
MDQRDPEYAARYAALRLANDQLRERGKEWLWDTLTTVCADLNSSFSATPGSILQTARQDWRFDLGKSVMVGERFGIRFRGKTMLLECGWPREPEHGFVPDQGLARARVSFSLSPFLTETVSEELILKPQGKNGALWFVIRSSKVGSEITESQIRAWVNILVDDNA